MSKDGSSIKCGICKKEVDKDLSHVSNLLLGLFWHMDCYDKANRSSYRVNKDKSSV